MEAFVLTLFICATSVGDGISEQVCKWHTQDYYQDEDQCSDAADKIKEETDTKLTTITKARCTEIKVL